MKPWADSRLSSSGARIPACTTAVRETTYRSGAMASRIGQLTVVDCLFIGVAQRHLEQARAALEATYEAVGGHRLETRPDRRRQKEA